MDAANAVPVVGQPLAYGIGFVVLLLVVFTGSWARALVTVAHECGHYAVGTLMGYSPKSLTLKDGGGGGTGYQADWWSPGRILRLFAGYATPPLLGLAGSTLVAHGKAWSVLVVSFVLVIGAFSVATNALAITVTALAALGVGWAVLDGTPATQTIIAVALVWLMLLGGLNAAIGIPRKNDSSDLAKLRRDTLIIPRIFWHAAFTVIAILCVWTGARNLLGI